MHAAVGLGLLLVPLMATPPERKPGASSVEVEVLGIVPLATEGASLLVLKEKSGGTVLPIVVGRSEGVAIDQHMRRAPSPRPLAAELLEKTIGALGGRVLRVEIRSAQAALFRARVTLQQGDRRVELDARPSDSVALAVAAHAPIFATREVMEEAGLTPQDLERLRSAPAPGGAVEERPRGLGPVQRF